MCMHACVTACVCMYVHVCVTCVSDILHVCLCIYMYMRMMRCLPINLVYYGIILCTKKFVRPCCIANYVYHMTRVDL